MINKFLLFIFISFSIEDNNKVQSNLKSEIKKLEKEFSIKVFGIALCSVLAIFLKMCIPIIFRNIKKEIRLE